VELSNPQSNPPCSIELFDSKVNPASNKQKTDVKKPQIFFNDNTRKFQTEWATRLPWAEGLMLDGSFIHTMRCRVCFLIKNKCTIVGCKWDILTKHQGHKIVAWNLLKLGVKKGLKTIAKDCADLKKIQLYV
jgi:hypothetical protein